MSKVYVVSAGIDYDVWEILAVFDNKAAADLFVDAGNKRVAAWRAWEENGDLMRRPMPDTNDWYAYTEMEVQS